MMVPMGPFACEHSGWRAAGQTKSGRRSTTMTRPGRVRGVEATHDLCVRLAFTDGTTREIDLAPFLRGPVFDCIRADPAMFRTVAVDPLSGTIVWPGGADIDPDVLYHG